MLVWCNFLPTTDPGIANSAAPAMGLTFHLHEKSKPKKLQPRGEKASQKPRHLGSVFFCTKNLASKKDNLLILEESSVPRKTDRCMPRPNVPS